MRGFIDLHCHWVTGIDDGATTAEMGIEMLQALGKLGFDQVIATPHMRPGLYDNTRAQISAAYQRMTPLLEPSLPKVGLGSEHYFDDVVYARVLAGEGLLYPGERAVLFEFYEQDFPTHIERLLAEVKRRNITPVIAHPERYQSLWRDPERIERLLDVGAVALLDAAAVVGKYGQQAMRCSLALLERGAYTAACSDAHRASDIPALQQAIARLQELQGSEGVDALFRTGPSEILAGQSRC